jgi:hypothetical protein
VPAAAWQELPTSIVIGTHDGFVPLQEQRQAAARFSVDDDRRG